MVDQGASPNSVSGPTRDQVVVAGHLGDPAVARTGLDARDPAVRSSALGALARLDALTADEMCRGLQDDHARVIRRALELAAHVAEDDAAVDGLLLGHATGPDDDLAEMAVWALGERWQERGDEPDAGPIVDAVEHLTRSHTDPLVREAAVAALGAIGAQRSVSVIIAATGDKATVRRRAVIALAPFEGPEVEAALTAARSDRDWQVRQAAEDLLAPPAD